MNSEGGRGKVASKKNIKLNKKHILKILQTFLATKTYHMMSII